MAVQPNVSVTRFEPRYANSSRSGADRTGAGIGALDRMPAGDFRMSTRAALAERGWVAPNWPVEYGGAGLGPREVVVLARNCPPRASPSAQTTTRSASACSATPCFDGPNPNCCNGFCPRSSPASTSSPRVSPNLVPVRTSRRWHCAPSATGTSGCSTVKSCGRRRTPSELDVRPRAD